MAITPSTIRPVWGSGLTISGSVSGAGSTPVALEKQDWPYSAPYVQIATTNANSSGAFNFTVPALLITTHLRVVTRTAVPVTSPVTTASVAAKVGLKTRRLKRKRVRIEGAIWPAVPNGRVSLQRQTQSGKWGFIRRGKDLRARQHPLALPDPGDRPPLAGDQLPRGRDRPQRRRQRPRHLAHRHRPGSPLVVTRR